MGWTVGTWSGLPNYKCSHCHFATVRETEIETHVYEKHGVWPADARKELDALEQAQTAQALADKNKLDDLKALAESAGVTDTSGTKAEIAARIVGAEDKEMSNGD